MALRAEATPGLRSTDGYQYRPPGDLYHAPICGNKGGGGHNIMRKKDRLQYDVPHGVTPHAIIFLWYALLS